MKPNIPIGTYQLGARLVRVYGVADSESGEVLVIPEDKGIPQINVGLDGPWDECLAVLMHEIFELTYIDLNCRFKQKPGFTNSAADYHFFMTHEQFGAACDRIGYMLDKALFDLHKVYKIYHRERKMITRKKKKLDR